MPDVTKPAVWGMFRHALSFLVALFMLASGTAFAGPENSATAVPSFVLAEADAGTATPNVPVLRQQYVDEVNALGVKAATMRQAGTAPEEIARTLHADRRALGVKYKALTPPGKLAEIYERNIKKYGDKLGPTVDWLRKQGKSWEEIIESSSRTGGRDLGL